MCACVGLVIIQNNTAWCETYDLKNVKDIQAFQGSLEAENILAKNGFVVADPFFKQIFQAYIESPMTGEPSEKNPMGTSLPSFITTDSAWDTYHFLLEEGVKQLETIQAQRLHAFSSRLLEVARQKNEPDLVSFASVGEALQDANFLQTLNGDQKTIVDGLRNGNSPVNVPIGFDLSPLQFRAQSFYADSPELSDYFASRQWYASVVFRLTNPRETKLAITLAALVNNDSELSNLWKQLSDSYDELLGKSEDGTVRQYVAATEAIVGTNNPGGAISDVQIQKIQQKLSDQLPLPAVNDQWLSQEQYLQFGKETRGLRLLPPRSLPDGICFQTTVDPIIPGRAYPSGLDFFTASPILRSPAAVRAERKEFGNDVAGTVLKTDCGPMPDSLHGEAMQLLAKLQEPLPAQVPAAMRTDAWGDLQLWSQLGAWAEQRHTWALHTKQNVEVMGLVSPPPGMVAPYPEFFTGLAKLTRETAAALDKAGLGGQFDIETVASDLLKQLRQSDELKVLSAKIQKQAQQSGGFRKTAESDEYEKLQSSLDQLNGFLNGIENRYYETNLAEVRAIGWQNIENKIHQDMEALAIRCTNGQANTDDTRVLRAYFDCRQDIVRPINNFAPVCDRLAVLAKKCLDNEALTEDDAAWIRNYGITLAGFHFYGGNSYEVPEDNFPIVTRIFANATTGSTLYVGLARPQALYIIVPSGHSLQLYRGAVMTYREFVRPDSELLDDDSWREMLSKGQTPPPPPFTASFYAQAGVKELLEKLTKLNAARATGDDENSYKEVPDVLSQINSTATDKDIPVLIKYLKQTDDQNWDIVDALAETIGQLQWQSYQNQIIGLVSSPGHFLPEAAARILIERPDWLDTTALTSNFDQQPARTRRLCCAILSHLPQQTENTAKLLLGALKDPDAGVRWQAALAIKDSGWNNAQSQAALVNTLDDKNEFVAAAAAYSLGQLGATNAAPALLSSLVRTLQSSNAPPDELQRQAFEITAGIRGDENEAVRLLDPDNQATRLYIESAEVLANFKRSAAFMKGRFPPGFLNRRTHNYDLATALIEALGDLRYQPAANELSKLRGTDYDFEATEALGKLTGSAEKEAVEK